MVIGCLWDVLKKQQDFKRNLQSDNTAMWSSATDLIVHFFPQNGQFDSNWVCHKKGSHKEENRPQLAAGKI